MDSPLRLLIYEDNPDLRLSLSQLFDLSEDFDLVGMFENGENIASALVELSPDVILMDIDMPVSNGLDTLQKAKAINPAIPVIMYTVFDDNDHLFEALKRGANGYLLKKTPPARLLSAIVDIRNGEVPMSAAIAQKVLRFFSEQPMFTPDYGLTNREKQLLKLLVEGFSYKMIAAELLISIDTVRSHIKKVYEKLNVHSVSEAVSKAIRQKLV
jgi:DNA-binding NarL/FixJ family response regulator